MLLLEAGSVAEVIGQESGRCVLLESEIFKDRSCCFLVEYGKNNQHESWAYLGFQYVQMSGACLFIAERAAIFQVVALGLGFPLCAVQRSCPSPCHAV